MAELLDDSGHPITLDDGITILEDDTPDPGPSGTGGGNGMRPAVNLTELDGAIGTLPAGTKILAIAGPADGGPLNMPAAFARKQDVVSNFVGGPLVEEATTIIELYGVPVLLCRTGNTTDGTVDAIDVTGKVGSTAVTAGADITPNDDYDLYFQIATGGVIGVAGITFKYSYDGGRTLSPTTALGTATSFTFPNSGGMQFLFGAGAFASADVVKMRTHAPNWNNTDIGNAIVALGAQKTWDILDVVGPVDGTSFDVIDAAVGGLKRRMWLGSFRLPTTGESEAAYKTAFDAAFGGKGSTRAAICAGDAEIVSGNTFRVPRTYIRRSVAGVLSSVTEEIDLADVNRGALRGTSIRDANGNVLHHDEAVNPGLDDSRAITLTTQDEVEGVYITNPNLLSAAGSDFAYIQHRRVMNKAEAAVVAYLTRRLSKPITVSKKTGFITESEALEIEAGANAALRGALLAKPQASDATFTLSRTDNVLLTRTLTGQAAIVPLAYPKVINVNIGFRNPSLAIVTK